MSVVEEKNTHKQVLPPDNMGVKRKRLTLQQKIEVLNYAKNNKTSIRSLANKFQIGRTQANDILKNEIELYQAWASSGSLSAKNKIRRTENIAVDDATLAWFFEVRERKIPVTGPLLKQKALEIAGKVGLKDFKASNGWLEKFIARHKISLTANSNEANIYDKQDLFVDEIDNSASADDCVIIDESLVSCDLLEINQSVETINESNENKADTHFMNFSSEIICLKKTLDTLKDIKRLMLCEKNREALSLVTSLQTEIENELSLGAEEIK